jgi:hypothetical protein
VSPGAPPAGLCNSCRHQQLVRNTRGSVFSLCRRSKGEPERFPRYPRVPVLRCEGWEPRLDGPGESGEAGESGEDDP